MVDVLEYLTCLLSPRITNSSRSGNIPINVFTSVDYDYDNAVGKVTIHDRQTDRQTFPRRNHLPFET